MTEKPDNGVDILAHWHFNSEQWKEFRYYEKLEFDNRAHIDEKSVLIGGIVVIVLVAIGASFVPNRMGHQGSLAASILVFILGSVFLGGCFLIYRLIRKNNEQKLNTETGQVVITRRSANVNGVVFEWFSGWGLPRITESYIHIGSEKMLLLRFQCSRMIRVRNVNERIEKIGLVPVPPGREPDARAAAAAILEKWPIKD